MAGMVCGHDAPPPPLFSQVFILKAVKVLCFDTLLQVLILKVVTTQFTPSFSDPQWGNGLAIGRSGAAG
jgi:hypothetical protein